MLLQTENQNPNVYCCAYPRILEYFSLTNGILENGNIRMCSALILAAFRSDERIQPEGKVKVQQSRYRPGVTQRVPGS